MIDTIKVRLTKMNSDDSIRQSFILVIYTYIWE